MSNQPQSIPEGKAFDELPDGEYLLSQPIEGFSRTLDGRTPVDATIVVIRDRKPFALREAEGKPMHVLPRADDAPMLDWPGLQFSIGPGQPPHIVIDRVEDESDGE